MKKIDIVGLWVISIIVVFGLGFVADLFGWAVSNTVLFIAIGVPVFLPVILSFILSIVSIVGRSRYSYLDDLSQQQGDDEGDGGGGE